MPMSEPSAETNSACGLVHVPPVTTPQVGNVESFAIVVKARTRRSAPVVVTAGWRTFASDAVFRTKEDPSRKVVVSAPATRYMRPAETTPVVVPVHATDRSPDSPASTL
jgi:hypothetical protein